MRAGPGKAQASVRGSKVALALACQSVRMQLRNSGCPHVRSGAFHLATIQGVVQCRRCPLVVLFHPCGAQKERDARCLTRRPNDWQPLAVTQRHRPTGSLRSKGFSQYCFEHERVSAQVCREYVVIATINLEARPRFLRW